MNIQTFQSYLSIARQSPKTPTDCNNCQNGRYTLRGVYGRTEITRLLIERNRIIFGGMAMDTLYLNWQNLVMEKLFIDWGLLKTK